MSFILDALKKSETDRQQDASPGIAAIPVSSGAAASPRWVAMLGLLLAVNVVLIAVLILRPDSPSIDARQTASSNDMATSIPPDTAPQQRVTLPSSPAPANATVRRTDESGLDVQAPQSTSREATDEPPVQVANSPQARVESITTRAPAATDRSAAPVYSEPAYPEPAEIEETYMTFDELRASGAFNLPDMHVDLHVYSDDPADRLVFINMTQYRENATLADGPRLRRITPEGAILEYQGTRFLLPRE